MAVVDELEGLDVSACEVGCSVSDARLSPTLVAKATATLGLPNLLRHTSSGLQSSEERSEYNSAVIWKTESCCSCTPRACMTGHTSRDRDEEMLVRSASSTILLYPAVDVPSQGTSTDNGNKTITTFTSLSCTDPISNTSTLTLTNRRYSTPRSSVGSRENEDEVEGDGATISNTVQPLCENSGLSEKSGDRSPEGKVKESITQWQNSRTTYRRQVADYEREWTFRPKLNHASIRLASQAPRSHLPVSHRLYENRRLNVTRLHENFTFCPKLNEASLRLAQARAERLPEVSRTTSLNSHHWCVVHKNCRGPQDSVAQFIQDSHFQRKMTSLG